jgi:hypothetical protein
MLIIGRKENTRQGCYASPRELPRLPPAGFEVVASSTPKSLMDHGSEERQHALMMPGEEAAVGVRFPLGRREVSLTNVANDRDFRQMRP